MDDNQFTYRVISEIGRGGLGTVHEIEVTASTCSLRTGQRLAKKTLNEIWKNNPTCLDRFEREIAVLKSMSHPRILSVAGENISSGSERFYCMNLYPGSLRNWLARSPDGSRADWRNLMRFGADIADALHHAHSRGFYHRDIKPENILLESSVDGRFCPVVADWGLGYFVHKNSMVMTQLTRGGMGTEYYCSAEQWSTGKCGPEGDVYSLGMTLAETLTGKQNRIGFIGGGISYDLLADRSPGPFAVNQLLKEMTDPTASERLNSMASARDRLLRISRM